MREGLGEGFRMTDEKLSERSSPSLAARVNAVPFVPASQSKESRKGSFSGADARPFVPGSGKPLASPINLGAEAKPFVPSSGSGSSNRLKGINASAAAFVPATSSGRQSPISGVGGHLYSGNSSDGGRTPRSGYQSRSNEAEEYASTSTYDPRAGYALPGPVSLGTPRSGYAAGSYPLNGYTNRAGRGRSPVPRPVTPPLTGGRGGRFPPLQTPGRGLGQGRGAFSPHAHHFQGLAPGMGALARAHHNAAYTVEQMVPQLQAQGSLTLTQMSAEMQAELGYPDMLQQFHSLYPLEDEKPHPEGMSRSLGVHSTALKGVSMQDGLAFAIRQFSWQQVTPSPELLLHANQVVEAWAPLALHPNLSVPRLAFVSMDIGGRPCLYLGHDFYPTACSLEAAHLQPQVTANGLVQVPVSEDAAWGYLMQMAAALRAVHSMGLACRAGLAPSKVLLLPGSRLRLGSLGVAEVLAGMAARQDDVAALQREDLLALGQLMLQLLCGSAHHPSLDHCAAVCSPELTHIVASLLGQSQDSMTSWHQLTDALRDHSFVDLDAKHLFCDALIGQLGKELENGRLLRLLVKLSTITERVDMDTQWAETGDRYLLKLFRDFVFHQCDENGSPILDWAHVAEALSKVDAGVPEKIVLLSRDEASMLVVSYADVKQCVENTYGDLKKLALPGSRRSR